MLFEEFSKLRDLLCEEMSTRQEFQKYIHKTLGHEYTYGGHGQVVHKATKQVTHIMDGTGKAEKLAQPYEHDDRPWYEKNYATRFKTGKKEDSKRRRASRDDLEGLPLHKRSKYANLFDKNERRAIEDYSESSDDINSALQHGKYASPEEIDAHENLIDHIKNIEKEQDKAYNMMSKMEDKIELAKEQGKDTKPLKLQHKQHKKAVDDFEKELYRSYGKVSKDEERVDIGKQIKHLDSAFEKVEPPEHEKVYFRGLNNVELKRMRKGVNAGERYHTATHMSTTTDPSVARNFSKGLMVIHHPVNSKAKVLNMAHLGNHDDEHEHLISRNTEFHVIKVEPGNKNKPHKIHVRLT